MRNIKQVRIANRPPSEALWLFLSIWHSGRKRWRLKASNITACRSPKPQPFPKNATDCFLNALSTPASEKASYISSRGRMVSVRQDDSEERHK